MASTILNMDAAALYVGDDDPTDAEFLTIKNIKIPALEEATKDHSGGGAMSEIAIGTRKIVALVLSFQLEGFNPKVMSRFMPGGPSRIKYTVRGNVRDVRDHTDLEIKAIIEGRMTKYEPSEFEKDSGMTSDYEVKEVTKYQLFFGQQEKFFFDYFLGPRGLRIDGQPMFPALARNLGMA